METKKPKIIYKIERKPDHFYYVDTNGSIVEMKSLYTNYTLKEKLKSAWIDLKRLFKLNNNGGKNGN